MSLSRARARFFGGFHQLALARTLVIDATEVEDAMDDDAVEFVVVGFSEEFGIGAHGVEADHDVSIDDVFFIVVESDDIGIKVVTEVLVVDLEYLLVVNKHISHLAHTTSVAGSYGPDPGIGGALLYGGHAHALYIVCNHCLWGIKESVG